MSDPTGDDVPRDPWGNPLGPDDRAPVDPQPEDYPPPFPSDPPGGAPSPWDSPAPEGPPSQAPPPLPPEPPSAPPANPAWPGSQPTPPPAPPSSPPPGWGGPGVPPQQPYYPAGGPYPGYPQGTPWAPPKNDGMAIGSLVSAIVGLLCCGIVLAPLAITLGLLSRKRIRESNGALRGDGLAITGIVLGCVGVLLAIVGIVIYIRNPDALNDIFSGLTTTTAAD